ncbi:MAG: efflux RND transporter periplasmic adaptor subunit [Planctomycetes bacterium]|nr:efflux RND transporter periplasmic adaptor subunit [Planctomycetota bacterium]
MVTAAALTTDLWWTPIRPRIAELLAVQAEAETVHEEHEDHLDPDILTISKQALQTLGIEISRVEPRGVYERTIRVPGRIVEIPGASLRDVTAGLSGVITKVYVRKGEEIEPGDRLFDISLVHETAIQLQLDLLDALGKQEVTDLEIQRLTGLNQDRPDLISRSRILQQQYERRRLNHTIESRKQALLLLGFSENQITHLMREHGNHAPRESQSKKVSFDDYEHPLIDSISIRAPGEKSNGDRKPPAFLVSELPVHPGEHVETGQLLCRLADYRTLYIEGRAFEHQLPDIRRAMRQQWPVTAVLVTGERKNLRILFQDPKVDPDSRTTRFYVELTNSRVNSRRSNGRFFVDWESRPGQLVEVRVPVERMENKLVVPVDAVAQHGPDNYVFQASGSAFLRRPVTIEYRDHQNVVLGAGSRIYEGDTIAISGAYQLQLALLNRASGPVDPHAGHSHD